MSTQTQIVQKYVQQKIEIVHITSIQSIYPSRSVESSVDSKTHTNTHTYTHTYTQDIALSIRRERDRMRFRRVKERKKEILKKDCLIQKQLLPVSELCTFFWMPINIGLHINFNRSVNYYHPWLNSFKYPPPTDISLVSTEPVFQQHLFFVVFRQKLTHTEFLGVMNRSQI